MEPVSCAGCRALQRRLRDLQAENERLRRQLDEATRAGKRQAAPFAKGQPAGQPKKPGRKPGRDYGTNAHRQPPTPDQVDEVHEAPLPDRCPDCGGPLDETQLSDLTFPPKANAANERLAQHVWAHRDDLFTFLRQPGLDATNWRAELAIRFGAILRKVWGGSRTWAGARAQSVLMSVWRTCWQQGRSALDFLSQFLRGGPVALAAPP
jgi:hypothetical protein